LQRIGRGIPVPLNICGERIFIRTLTPDLRLAASSLSKEFQVLSDLFSREQKGLIIDAGGYIGTAAIALAKMYPEATVVSIEPSSANFSILKRNVAVHRNIKVHHAALVPDSDRRVVPLMYRGTGEWGCTLVKNPEDKPAILIENVQTICIDDLLKIYQADRIMIFKMDIEGAELDLFRRSDWLDKTDCLIVELHERIVAGCEKAFHDANKSRYVYKSDGEKFISISRPSSTLQGLSV